MKHKRIRSIWIILLTLLLVGSISLYFIESKIFTKPNKEVEVEKEPILE